MDHKVVDPGKRSESRRRLCTPSGAIESEVPGICPEDVIQFECRAREKNLRLPAKMEV